ncbi:MAG: LamG domain-containing protein, partial [Chloroflexi bacterium]|nr:LamG domain-containing protein [Chloroflexota bacterium]
MALCSPAPLPGLPGVWYHIVLTLAVNDLKCYVNGELKATDTDTLGADGIGTATPIYFGRNIPGTAFFPGSIDDARIYNRVLTPEEVQGLAVRPTVHYANRFYEKDLSTGQATTYYYHGSSLVALRKGTTLEYVHQDHLGGTLLTTSASG